MSENINHRQIQWFPGHMARTLRLISENRKNVDVVLQLLDARIPRSSLNPELEKATQGKPHLYLLNKADLADEAVTARWKAYFKAKGDGCLALSSKQRTGMQEVKAAISAELSALLEKREPYPNARQAANITCAGILSHESALQGGKTISLPDWTFV